MFGRSITMLRKFPVQVVAVNLKSNCVLISEKEFNCVYYFQIAMLHGAHFRKLEESTLYKKNPHAGGDVGMLLLVYRLGEKPANEAMQRYIFHSSCARFSRSL
jgi:hypothetical protein